MKKFTHPIKPQYDGSEDGLMQFSTQLDIRCQDGQDEGWAPATYIKVETRTYDLTYEFAFVPEATIVDMAKQCWTSPDVTIYKHTINGHDTCNVRLLAKCHLNSITSSLTMIIINHIPQ